MNKLLMLEFKKLKRTFLTILLPLSFILPGVLVLVQYGFDNGSTLTEAVTKSSVFIQMISFACTVISGCYIVTREYKNNIVSYLAITPKSMTKILISKYMVLFLETTLLQILVFGTLLIINTVLNGFDIHTTAKYLNAGILSSLLLFCLTPAIVYVSLLKRNMSSSALIFLFVFMLTFPFAFRDYGFIFPHLVPLMLVSKFLGASTYANVNYLSGILILIGVFVLFLFLSINRFRRKD